MILLFYCLLLLWIGDQFLGLIGFPGEIFYRSAHDADQQKKIQSTEFEYEFATNDQGFRYPEIPLEKPPNEFRVLLLGDSFTEGQGVSSNETFGALLEEHFNSQSQRQIRFINGGMAGTGPIEYWRVLVNTGMKYNPDAILISLFANDLPSLPEYLTREDLERRSPEITGSTSILHTLFPRVYTMVSTSINRQKRKRRKALGYVGMMSEHAREQGIDEARIREWQASLPSDLVEAAEQEAFNGTILARGLLTPWYWSDALDVDTPRAERKLRSMRLALDEIVSFARQRGIQVAFSFIPDVLQYDRHAHRNGNLWSLTGTKIREQWVDETAVIQTRLAQWAREHSVPFLDLTPVFRAEIGNHSDLNWELDGHWTAEGHKVAAMAFVNWIEREEVLNFLSANSSQRDEREPVN